MPQSLRHRTQVVGDCVAPSFQGLSCEFLELLCDRMRGFLPLGLQRTRERVFNPVLDSSQVAAYLIERGFGFIRAPTLQVFEGQSDSFLEFGPRFGDNYAGDGFEVRVKVRLEAAH